MSILCYRQDNGYHNGSNQTNSEVNTMSASAMNPSNNGISSPNSVPIHSTGFLKGSLTSTNEEGGHQPPDPPHRSFSSDVSASIQQTAHNNR